jgi:hypothetical protein
MLTETRRPSRLADYFAAKFIRMMKAGGPGLVVAGCCESVWRRADWEAAGGCPKCGRMPVYYWDHDTMAPKGAA